MAITRERLIELGSDAIRTYIEYDLKRLGRKEEATDSIEQWDELQKLMPVRSVRKKTRRDVVSRAGLFLRLSRGMCEAGYTKKQRRHIQKMCADAAVGTRVAVAVRECSGGYERLCRLLMEVDVV